VTSPDPVVARRRRIARAAELAQRLGYLLFLVAIVAFVACIPLEFPRALVTLIVACLVVGSVFLAPAIVVGYAVKAADREDRERGLG
jgi:hypothetical protein